MKSFGSVLALFILCTFGASEDSIRSQAVRAGHKSTWKSAIGSKRDEFTLEKAHLFTVKAYQNGYRNPGNLTGFDMVARNGAMVLAPPSCRVGGGSQCHRSRTPVIMNNTQSAILFTDYSDNTAYLLSGQNHQVFIDMNGQLLYHEVSGDRVSDRISGDAIYSPFYRIGRNPRSLVYDNSTTSDTGGADYSTPAPAVFVALPWTGSFFYACPVYGGMYSLHLQLAYWFPHEGINSGNCTQVWLSAIDYKPDN